MKSLMLHCSLMYLTIYIHTHYIYLHIITHHIHINVDINHSFLDIMTLGVSFQSALYKYYIRQNKAWIHVKPVEALCVQKEHIMAFEVPFLCDWVPLQRPVISTSLKSDTAILTLVATAWSATLVPMVRFAGTTNEARYRLLSLLIGKERSNPCFFFFFFFFSFHFKVGSILR